ncbi:arylsulfatase [Mycetocola zhadangensis]|uniref:Arylsulfatase n=1 Tax=Mycetocola zhadangensis TaxID=1164595 RepID=A0A3L7J5W9_9MICO|nr:arylsulfatase [Mycetocola zhadangensis]RLQ86023.1 arylsulfatase [Mycetocola zhadangensis]GGE87747.1 arylsulfatase [Mycetocola zhadangensis]
MSIEEYEQGQPFPGTVARTIEESKPAWPAPRRSREGSPNILFVVLDDVGYGQLSCFGGLVDTPNIDRIAASGLRYANMHTTALCSPTRSSILTGRNHHSNGVACIMELATGYPGYDGRMPFENGMLPEILVEQGYNTFSVGKWHLSPSEDNTPAGPFHRWPLGRGFERFYGFLGGETNQWYPDLTQDNASVRPPSTPEEGYHLSEDLADQAIKMIVDAQVNAPDRPFFMYYASGAGHAPHHVPKEWADRYAGAFDMGWDAYRETVFDRQKELGLLPHDAELSRHDPDVPEWDTLSDDERRLYSRMMEVYAGFVTHADHHLGRVLDTLEKIGELDNTLIMIISDNGASSEGGVSGSFNEMLFFNNVPEDFEETLARIDDLGGTKSYNHYPWGWTWAGNTPFRRWKRETYRGGVADPFVVAWPAGFSARGEIRSQYAHAIDMVPTVLDALDIEPPKAIRGVRQAPIEGVSFAHTFMDADARTTHTTQYYEMFGHRSIDHDGWRAVCPWPGASFTESAEVGRKVGDPITAELLEQLDREGWELYDITEDPSESRNVASHHRDRLEKMIALWWSEAEKYKVLPLDGSLQSRLATERPQTSKPRSQYVYYPNGSVVPAFAAPPIFNRPYSIEADVDLPSDRVEGVLVAQGGDAGGYSLYFDKGRLTYVYNYVGRDEFEVSSPDPVSSGRHVIRFEFEPTGEPDFGNGKGVPGKAQLYLDGALIASTDFPHTTPFLFELEGLSCGYDFGAPASSGYEPPFEFTGRIHSVTFDLAGALIKDDDTEIARLMAQQ